MNINRRKPLHGNKNVTEQLDENDSQELLDNSNNTEEEHHSTESASDYYENEDVTTYYHHTGYKRQDSVPRTPKHSSEKSTNKRSPSVIPVSPTAIKPLKPMPQESSKNNFVPKVLAFFVIAIVAGAFSLSSPSHKHCSYEKLQKQYPQQKQNLWRTLKVGIELILNERRHSPAVYLFVHHGGQHVFHMVKDIAKHSSECFGPQMRPIEIDDFITTTGADQDYGHAIEKFKAKIKEGNVFLIVNLNEIPAEAARALHTICDTHSPIAENVVIFLTLTVPPNAEGTAVSNAENTLIELWSPKLDHNELDPLITRVTDQVLALQN